MSIYSWILARQADGGFASDVNLPDHDDLGPDGGAAWVPGAYEALLMRSDYSIRRYAFQNYLLARKVKKQITKPSDANREAAETALRKTGAIAVVDPLASFLISMRTDRNAARSEAMRLAAESGKRELVKVGIALLGVFGSAEDIPVIETLSSHEEFTFYGAPAIRALAGAEKVNGILLPLCDRLDGWGKTAILYELNYSGENGGTASDYLLRRGCANRLGTEINANLCATKGRLSEKLEELCAPDAELPDGELFRGICDIMWGLTVFDGVHDSINDYKHGINARSCFKELVESKPVLCETDGRAAAIIERMR